MMLKVNIFLCFFLKKCFYSFFFKSTHAGSTTQYIYVNIVSDAAYINPQIWTIMQLLHWMYYFTD